MKKEKVIHTRVSDIFYDVFTKKAEENDMTISNYSREVLENTVNVDSNPFRSDDFLHVVQWIYDVRGDYAEAFLFDVQHYFKIIKKHYHNLNSDIQELFDNVIKDLIVIRREYRKLKDKKDWGEFVYLFGQEEEETYFDYDKFEERSKGLLPF